MKRILVFATSLLLMTSSVTVGTGEQFDYQAWVQNENIPVWVRNAFAEGGFDRYFEFSFHLNPCYLRGDFNGDGDADVALLIRSISDSSTGIAVCHYGLKDLQILGAGTSIGNGGSNLTWMDIWSVFRKGEIGQGASKKAPPTLLGDALKVEKSESASGLIYWDGKRYVWYQQGD